MDPAIRKIIGKTIKGIVASEHNNVGPPTQLFLVFDDGTAYELYGDIYATGALDTRGETGALTYIRQFGGIVRQFDTGRDS